MTEHELPPLETLPLSQAEWTPSIVVERDVEYRRRRVAYHDLVALTVGAAAITAAAIFGIWASIVFFAGWAVVPSLLLLIGLVYTARRIDRRRDRLQAEAAEADRILKDEFGEGEGWLVDLKILQGGSPTGEDRGMLWFEDGKMVFSGHRTSFALSSDQARGRCGFQNKILGLRHSIALKVDLVTEAGPVSLSIEPPAWQHGMVVGAINHWVGTSPVPGGQFPPTSLGPGAPSLRQLFVKAVTCSAYWMFLTYVAILPGTWNAFVLIFALGFVAAYVLRLLFPVARWYAWDARRKLPR